MFKGETAAQKLTEMFVPDLNLNAATTPVKKVIFSHSKNLLMLKSLQGGNVRQLRRCESETTPAHCIKGKSSNQI